MEEPTNELIEFMQAEFNSAIEEAMEKALRYRFKDDSMTILVKNNKVTFLGNVKYSEEQLTAIIKEVRRGKFE